MTTLHDRPGTALLILDPQNGVVDGNYQRDAVIANVSRLADQARREQVPIIWFRHSDPENLIRGSEDWQIVPELARLIVAGAQADECIRSTLHGAIVRGYDAILVSDAHTTEDQTEWGAPPPDQVIAHTNLYWTYHRAPGRTAETVESGDVSFAP